MFKLLLLVAAAGGPAPSHLGSQLGPLPDFPTQARSGECWARMPVGPAAQTAAPGGQTVWTLHRGTGPTAIWTLNQRPGPAMAAAVGPLGWAQVDCGGGVAYARAPAAPPSMAGPAAPPPMSHPLLGRPSMGQPPMVQPPMAYAPPTFDGPPAPERAQPAPFAHRGFGPGGHPPAGVHQGPSFHGPMAHGPGPHGPGPHAHGGLGDMTPPTHFGFGPSTPFGFAPPPHGYAPPRMAQRSPVAPWFGGRYLTWPGKTLR